MQLVKKWDNIRSNFHEVDYYCELTKELDKFLIGYSELYRVYVYDCRDKLDSKIMSLRVPGSTIGYIEVEVINNKLIIIDIVIAEYALRRFDNELSKETLKKFIGQQIEFPAIGILEEEGNGDELQS